MAMGEPMWVFNNNVEKHRGVWHFVRDLEIQIVPEDTTTRTRNSYEYHEKHCPLYWGGSRGEVCVCKFNDSSVANRVIGQYTEIVVTPQHYKFLPARPVCGQVVIFPRISKTGGPVWGRNHQPGKTYAYNIKVGGLNVWEDHDIIPPGPVCSRCVTKVERDAT